MCACAQRLFAQVAGGDKVKTINGVIQSNA
jgi:hypothetical protein